MGRKRKKVSARETAQERSMKSHISHVTADVFRNLALFTLFMLIVKYVARFTFGFDYLLLFFVLILFGTLAYAMREKQEKSLRVGMASIWILLILIIAAGLFYRAYDLGHDSYWIDESYSVLAAKNIGEYGFPMFDSGDAYTRAIPHSYLLFGMGALFGYGHIPMRILSVLAGTLLILVIFLIVRRFYDARTALLTSFFVAFSYYQIAWSRQARMYVFLELFFFLSIYGYLLLVEKYSHKRLISLGIYVIIAALFHPMALVLVPVFALHALLTRPKQAVELMKSFTQHLRDLMEKKPSIIFVIAGAISILLWILFAYIGNLHLEFDYSGPYSKFVLSSYLLFLLLGTIGFFSNKHFKKNLVFVLSGLALFLLVSFFVPSMNFRYLFIASPILFLLSTHGIAYLNGLFTSSVWKWAVNIIIIVLLVSSSFLFLPKNSYELEPGTPQPPFAEAYAALQLKEGDLLVVTQPAIAELYMRKADYWLAISYTGRPVEKRDTEHYTGIPVIYDADALQNITHGYLVIDDMGLQRLSDEKRALVQALPLLSTHGSEFWNTVFVYGLGLENS